MDKKSATSNKVLVRAFQNEPVALRAVAVRGNTVEVAGADRRRSIRLPQRDVFSFDTDLYDALSDAYKDGKESELRKLWANAERFSPESTG